MQSAYQQQDYYVFADHQINNLPYHGYEPPQSITLQKYKGN
jgi:hypothetical protein